MAEKANSIKMAKTTKNKTVNKRLVSLLSGGIDSAVSSFLMMKKGAEVIFVHFHNQTLHKEYVKNKVVRIAQIVAKECGVKTKLYLVPFGGLQQELIKVIPAECRMIVYRRIMLKIAEKILKKEKAFGFITGDSIGQVASQTLDNLRVIYSATKYPILSPLIGYDKIEIIRIAEKIGTFETSVLPYSDCCSFMLAKHPDTKSDLKKIEELESRIDIKHLVEKAFKEAKITEIP